MGYNKPEMKYRKLRKPYLRLKNAERTKFQESINLNSRISLKKSSACRLPTTSTYSISSNEKVELEIDFEQKRRKFLQELLVLQKKDKELQARTKRLKEQLKSCKEKLKRRS